MVRSTALLLASVALAVLLASGVALVAASPLATVASAQTNQKPNLLVVTIDDADLETYNDAGRLKAMTMGQGVYFENSFVSNPLCCPSRATFLRGQYSHNTGVMTNIPPYGGYERFEELGRHKDNLATRLKGAGYKTLMVGKYMNGFVCDDDVPPGWDSFVYVGWYRYRDNGTCQNLPKGTWFDDFTGSKAAGVIRNQAETKGPFFAWINFLSPHSTREVGVHIPPDRYAGTREDAALAPNPSRPEEDLSDKPQWVRTYADHFGDSVPNETLEDWHKRRVEMLEGVADNLKKIVTALRETGQYRNTYIVFTNDNGLMMGEHGISGTKSAPYEESIRVPLAIRGPGIPAGVVREQFVLNNDLAPTLLKWARVARPAYMDGRPLQRLLETPARRGWRDHVLVENRVTRPPDYKMVRTGGYAYVEYATGEHELYDMQTDPYQEQNVYGQRPDVEAELAKGLDALRGCDGQACMDAENTPLP
jgi:N-acetylglucosamine-6-sulfatase